MKLIEDLIESVKDRDAEVRNVVVGQAWTLVASIGCGVASCTQSQFDCAPEVAAELRHKHLGDLLGLCSSADHLQASIGIAALNSALAGRLDEGSFKLYSIPRAKDKSIAIVGDFPFTDDLKQLAREVTVIQKTMGPETRLDTDSERILRQADIAIIRGSAIVAGSLEHLLDLSRSCYTIVFGPSTPLSPILFEYGADQLVGIMIRNEGSAASCVIRGMEDLSECEGVEPVVLGRNQQSR
jgi:uncharacterized protein (DUF4213/DUF364 family)